MYIRGGRQFSREGPAGYGQHTGGRRRFRGQYFRTRTSPSRVPDGQDDRSSGPPNQGSNRPEQPTQHNYNVNNHGGHTHRQQSRDSVQHNDLEEIKELCLKLTNELDLVKKRIDDIATSLEQINNGPAQAGLVSSATTQAVNDVGSKQKRRIKSQRSSANDPTTSKAIDGVANDVALNGSKKRLPRRRQDFKDDKDKQDSSTNTRPLPSMVARGDDSTTQAADPSSEDKIEGEDNQGNDRVRRVFKRRKQHFNKRRFYNNRRRQNDSSERNSNDTSPQNELNGEDYRPPVSKATSKVGRRDKHINGRKRSFPELSESEISEIVQVLKRDFFSPEIEAVKKTIDSRGPIVAQEFASSILDHAMCDVTSPTKLSEIANNFYQLITGEQGGLEFQQGFYGALSTIANREEDIVIDAPRYMDTLGQILGECVSPLNTTKHKQLLKRFLNKCLTSYGQKSRAQLLASTMRGIARYKEDRFAKDIWDVACLKWSNFLPEDADIDKFIESEDVVFTTQTFSPLPKRPKRTPEELEKFADDVTNQVEKRCTPQTLEELVRDLELEQDERVDYLGQLIYAVVRGCLTTDSGDYKLDIDALNRYSSILNSKGLLISPPQLSNVDGDAKPNKKETIDAIALRALTALTKLWHQYNCPQNLMSTILLALHNQGAASYDALKTWLNSDDLKNIPGIGAARLNSKRCIEDLAASRV